MKKSEKAIFGVICFTLFFTSAFAVSFTQSVSNGTMLANYGNGYFSGLNGINTYFTVDSTIDWNKFKANEYFGPQDSFVKYQPTPAVTDSSGNNNGAIPFGANTYQWGKYKRSAFLDGSKTFLALPSAMKTGLTTFTISLWISTTEAKSSATYWYNPTILGGVSSGAASGDWDSIKSRKPGSVERIKFSR